MDDQDLSSLWGGRPGMGIATRLAQLCENEWPADAAAGDEGEPESRLQRAAALGQEGAAASGLVVARAESAVLRSLLAASASSVPIDEALGSAFSALARCLLGARVAFFELNAAKGSLVCVASAAPAGVGERCAPVSAGQGASMISYAVAQQRQVFVPSMKSAAYLPLCDADEAAKIAAVAAPVRCGRDVVGALYLGGTRQLLNASGIELVEKLAPAIGHYIEGARAQASLRGRGQESCAEAAKLRDFAAGRERLALLGQFTAGVAHEINNPLAFIKSNLGALASYIDDLAPGGHDPAEFLGEMGDIVRESLEGIDRIASIVSALKSTARQRANDRTRIDPAQAVRDAVTIFRAAKKHECPIDCELSAVPEVIGSASCLGQVLLNLMQNGLDAMGGRGTIVVRAGEEGGFVNLTVADAGAGIPLEAQASLFEPFFTTKCPGQGTGLGLYLSQEIVKEMGGAITFETGPKGTTFLVRVPVAPESAE